MRGWKGWLANQGSLPTKGSSGMLWASKGLSCAVNRVSVVSQLRTGAPPQGDSVWTRCSSGNGQTRFKIQSRKLVANPWNKPQSFPPGHSKGEGVTPLLAREWLLSSFLSSSLRICPRTHRHRQTSSAQADYGFIIPAPGFPWKQWKNYSTPSFHSRHYF